MFWSRGPSLQSVVPRTLKRPINPKKPWLNPHSTQAPTLPAFFQPVYFFFHFPYFEKVAKCLAKDNSGTMTVKSIHFKLDQKLFAPLLTVNKIGLNLPFSCIERSSLCFGMLRCWIVHEQAILMVKRQLHKISSVPRELGPDTKLTRLVGRGQLGSKCVNG